MYPLTVSECATFGIGAVGIEVFHLVFDAKSEHDPVILVRYYDIQSDTYRYHRAWTERERTVWMKSAARTNVCEEVSRAEVP
jgi:hypothetical protein